MITERTAVLAATTHMLCCSCGMYFSAAASSENDQGSMNLASNTASLTLDPPVECGRHPAQRRMEDLALDVGDDLTGIGLVPAPVKVFGDDPELDDEVAGQVLRLDLAAFFPPQPQQGGLIVAHNDPRVRAADEVAASSRIQPSLELSNMASSVASPISRVEPGC